MSSSETTVKMLIERTHPVRFNLPMTTEYAGQAFYIRDCYPEFYTAVLENFKRKIRYVSVTGTPGIGKSIFYLYFFHRFRTENPERTIVTASFRSNQKVKTCVVFKPHEKGIKYRGEIEYIDGAMYLFDGPPDMEPEGEEMVCFTSPNNDWFKSMKKFEIHTKMIMPPWDEVELLDANMQLGYIANPDAISNRFAFFGGVARFCLSRNEAFISDAKNEIECKIRLIDCCMKLEDCLNSNGTGPVAEILSHSVFHMIPASDNGETLGPRSFVYDFASLQIQELLELNIDIYDDKELDIFVRRIKGEPSTAPLVGKLFEGACHRLLMKGGNFTAEPLSLSAKRFYMELPAGVYKRACRTNQAAVDGYWYDAIQNRLLLFQMTINYKHEIKVGGIRQILADLKLLDRIELLDEVFLIFLVAKGMESFPVQDFDRSESLTLKSNVSLVNGIGPKVTQSLAKLGILTVEQFLQNSRSDCRLERLGGYRKLCENQLNEPHHILDRIIGIPQYRMDSSFDYKR